MTESALSSYLAAWDGLRHRLVRLAGDAAVLSDEIAEANAGATTARWAGECGRIARELAQALDVIDRLADDAADTAVVSLADVAEE